MGNLEFSIFDKLNQFSVLQSIVSVTMTDVGSAKDPSFQSGDKSSPTQKEGLKKNPVQLRSSLGLMGCLVNIAKYVIIGAFSLFVQKSGINWFLQLFGLALKPLNSNNKREKRKHSEVDNEDCDDEKTSDELEEMKMKRWRPDHVTRLSMSLLRK
eukprot:TRINITY_DN35715_c0_g1_i1.p1 TRINITY_DN35715_c0_g1~~TRINITY_DN35715_c0_g1_i1.p1  ORF type:complete len:173 (+),score=41.28 TRINITY_DN35715_c0_g1_i1:55-519(+)